jgi:hypothetical protein
MCRRGDGRREGQQRRALGPYGRRSFFSGAVAAVVSLCHWKVELGILVSLRARLFFSRACETLGGRDGQTDLPSSCPDPARTDRPSLAPYYRRGPLDDEASPSRKSTKGTRLPNPFPRSHRWEHGRCVGDNRMQVGVGWLLPHCGGEARREKDASGLVTYQLVAVVCTGSPCKCFSLNKDPGRRVVVENRAAGTRTTRGIDDVGSRKRIDSQQAHGHFSFRRVPDPDRALGTFWGLSGREGEGFRWRVTLRTVRARGTST